MGQEGKKSRGRRAWLLAGALVICSGVACAWLLTVRRVWTDGGSLSVPDAAARLREVLWTAPQPIGPDFESADQVYEPCISSDGQELYFVRGKAGGNADIWASYRRNNQWSKPVALDAVNSPFDDLGPRLTADGKFLLFYSNRPGGLGGYDIWASARTKDGWAAPWNLGPSVNSEFNEYSPDPTPDGKNLIFTTNRMAARSLEAEPWHATIRQTDAADYDLWIAAVDPAKTATGAEAAPGMAFRPATEIRVLNSPYIEGASCMSPAGDFLYFTSNRPSGFGKFDLYRSRVIDGVFGPPENLGPSINTADNEADPALALNGYRLYFSSDRPGAGGRYHLLVAESHEVYRELHAHAPPKPGWNTLLMLISAAVLVPLLFMLRGIEGRRLDLLQKCLLISVLIHVLVIFAMSFVAVTRQMTTYVKREMGVEVAFKLPKDLAEGMAVRSQAAGATPVAHAAPSPLPQTQVPVETLEAPATLQVGVPQAHAAPEALSIEVAVPVQVAAPISAVAPAVPAPQAPVLDLHLASPQALSQAEEATHARDLNPIAGKVAQNVPAPAPLPMPLESATPAKLPGSTASLAQSDAAARGIAPADAIRPDVGPVAAPVVTMPRAEEPLAATVNKGPTPSDVGAPSARREVVADPPLPHVPDFTRSIPPEQVSVQNPLQTPQTYPHAMGGKTAVAPTAPPIESPSIQITGSTVRQRSDDPQPPPLAEAVEAARRLALAPSGNDPAAAPSELATDLARSSNASIPAAAPSTRPAEEFVAELASRANQHATYAFAPTNQLAGPGEGPPVDLPVRDQPVQARTDGAQPATDPSGDPGPMTRPAMAVAGPAAMPGAEPADLAAPAQRPRSSAAISPAAELRMLPASVVGTGAVAKVEQPTIAPAPIVGEPQLAQPLPVVVAATTPTATEAAIALQRHDAIDSPIASAAGIDERTLSRPAVALASSTSLNDIAPSVTHSRSAPIDAKGAMSAPPGDVDGPRVGLEEARRPDARVAIAPQEGPSHTDGIAFAAQRCEPGNKLAPSETASVTFTPDVPSGSPPASKVDKQPSSGPPTPPRELVAAVPAPELSLTPLEGLSAPASPFLQRSAEERQPVLKKLGGTKESEDSVDKALAYLARFQEPDGRWTKVIDDGPPGHRPPDNHDMACTSLAVLAFLARDHTPAKAGPYRDVVARAVDFLISRQGSNGDLRGPHHLRGSGADHGNMYDHGIAALALSESALMTQDPRCINAAMGAARFITESQDSHSGGWRYIPREQGDTSVFGWQVMAMHSAEQLGFPIPEATRRAALHYIRLASQGPRGMLGGYQPGGGATPPMTAELLFARMLLGQDLADSDLKEATDFLARQPPSSGSVDLYYWYYASLSMLQMRNDAWNDWNARTRDTLIRLQQPAGNWDTNVRWGDRGGRIFTTAMATLTLEVYYRYLPLRTSH